ncbi:MAG: MBL fold metallo-hydrolase [Chloroflexota bacterium]
MQHERVSEDVYWFQSDIYAQVTAGVVVGPDWAVVIDTLTFPEETLEIRDFIEQELNVPARYVILTHYHADHSWGACFFPGATVVAHSLCRKFLEQKGIPSLESVKRDNSEFRSVKIVLPHLTFDEGELTLKVGKKRLRLIPLPGHSADGIGILVEDDRVLFAGDALMPLPFIVDGNYDDMLNTLKVIKELALENVIQGHGDIVLRGEVELVVGQNLFYLSAVRKAVREARRRKYALDYFEKITVEDCGKTHVLLGGMAEALHQKNMKMLYRSEYGEEPTSSSG